MQRNNSIGLFNVLLIVPTLLALVLNNELFSFAIKLIWAFEGIIWIIDEVGEIGLLIVATVLALLVNIEVFSLSIKLIWAFKGITWMLDAAWKRWVRK